MNSQLQNRYYSFAQFNNKVIYDLSLDQLSPSKYDISIKKSTEENRIGCLKFRL